jgi:NAD(P)-dependent dehydrogenase (short-subunit alcohol dehydrogenase family)
MRSLRGQVVLVTGASSGIGAATARRLASRGAKIVISARRADRLRALANEIDSSGANVVPVVGDVTNEADRVTLVDTTLERFGRIDALVNNAGYGTRGPVETVPLALVRKNYETNIFAVIALTQLVLPAMRARGDGCIVNIGSVAGRIARPLSSIYDSTKHALEAITDGLRGELKPFGVRVTLIQPGFIATEFVAVADAMSDDVYRNAGPYDRYLVEAQRRYDMLRRTAGRPEHIAALVEKALVSDAPLARYSGPFQAKLMLFLRWALPTRVLEHAMRLKH